MRPAGDHELIQIMDAALADSTLRSGHWLACRPGCDQCCTGVFRMNSLDAERLREGFSLAPEATQQAIRERVAQAIATLSADFPGDPATGILAEDDDALEAFEDFGNDATCPVLNPATGTCDLYEHRPMTCRTFGPPVLVEEGGYGICELCFVNAPVEAIKSAELHLAPPELEEALNEQTGNTGTTIIAFALQSS